MALLNVHRILLQVLELTNQIVHVYIVQRVNEQHNVVSGINLELTIIK